MTKLLKKISDHKLITAVILLIIFFGGYLSYKNLIKKDNKVRYTLSQVERGTVVVSISGSGQVSALEEISIKSKVSSEVSTIFVQKGEEIKRGKLIMKLNDADFRKAVRDAEITLEASQLELEKLLEPPDELSILQAENSLAQAKETKQKAEDNLEKSYEDGFNVVANVFLDLPTIMTGLDNILFGNDFSRSQWNISYYTDTVKLYDEKIFQYSQDAYDHYQSARKAYDQNFTYYKSTSRYSDNFIIDELINQTYETTKEVAESVKNAYNLVQFYKDKFTEHGLKPDVLADTHLSLLNTYTGKTNNHLLSLLSIKRAIEDNKENILNAERLIKEKEKSLAKLKGGPDELDIKAKKIIIQQKEDNLAMAKENLAKCYIYAPFDGLISDVKVKKDDSVSPGTILATLITKQKIVEVSLNEVEAAKVKIGQKATLTFDALPDLSINGKIVEVDIVGTVNQGVTSYGVKIALETDDERIKAGMTVTADIIVDAKTNVLVLPSNAIKSQAGVYYVELVEVPEEKKQEFLNNRRGILLPTKPKRQQVQIGISNDSLTEILSGLKEGDIVISSTITSTNQTSQRSQPFLIPGIRGGIR